MQERIDFDRPDLDVTTEEVERLPTRRRAAWAAACVGRVAELVSPYFRECSHLDRAIALTWDHALGARTTRKEAERLLAELTLVSDQYDEEHEELTAPNDWAIRDGYEHNDLMPGIRLLCTLSGPSSSAWHASDAVERAACLYYHTQCWRQACDAAWVSGYEDRMMDVCYLMSRRAFEVALAHKGKPSRQMFDGVTLPAETEYLPPARRGKRRLRCRVPPHEVAWLRETGRLASSWGERAPASTPTKSP